MAEAGQNQFRVVVPEGVSQEEVHDIILSVLEFRQWEVLEDESKEMTASLSYGGVNAHLALSYDYEVIVLQCTATDKKGKAIVPLRWARYLQKDMRDQLLDAADM